MGLLGASCGLAISLLLLLLGLIVLGWVVSWGGTLHIDLAPYVDIALGRGGVRGDVERPHRGGSGA